MAKPVMAAKNNARSKLCENERRISPMPKTDIIMNKTLLRFTFGFREAWKIAPPIAPIPVTLLR
jgi:hypothetical protein